MIVTVIVIATIIVLVVVILWVSPAELACEAYALVAEVVLAFILTMLEAKLVRATEGAILGCNCLGTTDTTRSPHASIQNHHTALYPDLEHAVVLCVWKWNLPTL